MENTLPQGLLDEVMSLSEEEKRALAKALKEMIASELAISAGLVVPTRCPHCGGEHVVRKGKDARGNQRHLCRDCNRTFGASTLSVMGQTKLTEAQWMAYAEGMADGRTLRELQERCGITLKTSWFCRMRVLEAMGKHLDAFRSGPGVAVEADGKMVHESFKGNNGRGGFEMPRRRHKSGKSLHVRGCSGQQVCVLCAVNDRGDVFATVMGRAHGSARLIEAGLGGVIEPGTHLITDDLKQYGRVAKSLGCTHEARPSKPEKGGKALGMVNEAHKRLERFLDRFHGVSTRRLPRYLNWFMWLEQFRRSDADRRDLVTREAMTGDYDTTIRGIFAEPRFDMGWWDGRVVA